MSRTGSLVVLLAIVVGSLGLCLHRLGAGSFWIDELFYVNGAISILEQGAPVLEGGRVYTRALPYTYVVAVAFKLFGVSEFAARIPSVMFGMLTIIGIFFVT